MSDPMRNIMDSTWQMRQPHVVPLFANQFKLWEQLQDCSLSFAAIGFRECIRSLSGLPV
jgi:hypothetical protein